MSNKRHIRRVRAWNEPELITRIYHALGLALVEIQSAQARIGDPFGDDGDAELHSLDVLECDDISGAIARANDDLVTANRALVALATHFPPASPGGTTPLAAP
jgi:hypothetical protein